MPSLKIKTKLAKSISKNDLDICPKSSVISKSSLSQIRSVQNAVEVADLIHSTQDVHIFYKVYPNQVGRNRDHANDLVDDCLKKQQPLVTGSPILDKMDSSVVTSKSSSKTIFSPNLEPVDAHNDSDISSDGESLIHSTLEHCDESDSVFFIFFSMKEHVIYVNQRPHLQTFLERFTEMFKVVIFTASQSIYAKQLLNILDPDGNIISRCAYRESCIL